MRVTLLDVRDPVAALTEIDHQLLALICAARTSSPG